MRLLYGAPEILHLTNHMADNFYKKTDHPFLIALQHSSSQPMQSLSYIFLNQPHLDNRSLNCSYYNEAHNYQ